MAWETRERGGHYYYRKFRVGGRVVSRYIGAGEYARLAFSLDRMEADGRDRERAEVATRRQCDAQADAELDALREAADVLTTAALLAAGFHTHSRQWRRTRGRVHHD